MWCYVTELPGECDVFAGIITLGREKGLGTKLQMGTAPQDTTVCRLKGAEWGGGHQRGNVCAREKGLGTNMQMVMTP